MKYRRDQMRIELVCGPACWYWYLMGPEDTIDHGSAGIYQHAANDALTAFDAHLDGFMPGV